MKSIYHDAYGAIHKCILETVQALPRRDRPSAKACRTLAQSISWVALSIRTACLVDFCRIPAPQHTLPKLIANLRKNCTACAPIFAVVDPTTEDTFFVNAQLLARKLSKRSSNKDDMLSLSRADPVLENVTFVLLDDPLQALESPPEPLQSMLTTLYTELSPPITELPRLCDVLPEVFLLPNNNLNPHVQVPFAGILLDYPIAYVPLSQPVSQDSSPYLNGHALDVFELRLRASRAEDSLELMKFSCPAEFLVSESSTTRNLNALRERLEVAIENLNSNTDGGDGPQWEIVFSYSRITVDRVAL